MTEIVRIIFDENLLMPVGILVMIIIAIWLKFKFSLKSREMINRERMALIEKGVYDFPMEKVETKRRMDIKWFLFLGFFLSGLGIALFISPFILMYYGSRFEDEMMIAGSIFLFPGIGTLLFYIIQSRKEKEDKENLNHKK